LTDQLYAESTCNLHHCAIIKWMCAVMATLLLSNLDLLRQATHWRTSLPCNLLPIYATGQQRRLCVYSTCEVLGLQWGSPSWYRSLLGHYGYGSAFFKCQRSILSVCNAINTSAPAHASANCVDIVTRIRTEASFHRIRMHISITDQIAGGETASAARGLHHKRCFRPHSGHCWAVLPSADTPFHPPGSHHL